MGKEKVRTDRADWKEGPSFEKFRNKLTYVERTCIMAGLEQAEASRFDLKLCRVVINLQAMCRGIGKKGART